VNFDSASLDLVQRLALALALGLLIGIERGWRERDERAGARTAGIRSFALLGLAGGLCGALVGPLGAWLASLVIATLGAVVAMFRYRENAADQTFSVTSVIVAFIVLLLGAYAVVGEMEVAAAVGVAVVALLAARESLHGWLQRLTWAELRSGILLLAMTFVALPLLPDRAIDPWGAINPHELWLMTILIAVISASGYAAVRIGGAQRGLIYGTLAGSLVSSTAVTFNLSHRARRQGRVPVFASVAALASAVSLTRAAAIIVALAPAQSLHFLSALLPPAGITVLCAAWAWRHGARAGSEAAPIALGNPLDLAPILRFAVLLAVVLVFAKLAMARFGESGFLGVAAIAGVADIDPITLAAARLAQGGEERIALAGVLLAILANMASKVSIGFVAGGLRFGLLHAALVAPAILVLGAWVLWITVPWFLP
jgi:uncharacterized membrane protein (DUF4010 family)